MKRKRTTKSAKSNRFAYNQETSVSYGAKTDVGGKYGDNNQDDFFVDSFLTPSGYIHLFGVFDGHGPHGETASKIARQQLFQRLRPALMRNHRPTRRQLSHILTEVFKQTHQAIIAIYPTLTTYQLPNGTCYKRYNLEKSGSIFMYKDKYNKKEQPKLHEFGTTAVVTIYFENKKTLVTASVGDSYGVVGRFEKRKVFYQMLNPSDGLDHIGLPSERDRIRSKTPGKIQGRYLLGTHPICGTIRLAMTRSLGHMFMQTNGVIWEPHITYLSVGEKDNTLILGSDGLWDVVTREDAVKKCLKMSDTDKAAQNLIKDALEGWERTAARWGTDKKRTADNITVIVARLDAMVQK